MKKLKTKIQQFRKFLQTYGSPYTEPYTVVTTKRMCFSMDEFDEQYIKDEARATRGLKRKPQAQYERESKIADIVAMIFIIGCQLGLLLLLDWFFYDFLASEPFRGY